MKILVYRLGSLGDSLLCLPSLKAIRAAHPHAHITILTNRPVHSKAPPIRAVLEHMGLADGYLDYPVGTRDWRELFQLRRKIAMERFDFAVNLTAARGRFVALRDLIFFLTAGISRVYGTPWRRRDLYSQKDTRSGRYEWEASRLYRRVTRWSTVDIEHDALWDLLLTEKENAAAREALRPLGLAGGFLAISFGTKVEVKDWTEEKWLELIGILSKKYPRLAVVAVGSEEESERTTRCLAAWEGPWINLCGRLSVRSVAAVLSRARLFLGHDSGPMHLAATVGVPCVAIFSARNLIGQWFPRGTRNLVFYRDVPCSGCELQVCLAEGKKCILGIRPIEVARAVEMMVPRLKEH